MNYDSLIRRANKIIDKVNNKANAPKVYILEADKDTENLNGLVILLSESINLLELNHELYHETNSKPV